MSLIRMFTVLGAGGLLAFASSAQTLYDAGQGTLPEAQGWSYAAIPSATKLFANNSALLDTTASLSIQAGWNQVTAADLNRARGFGLIFTALVNAEAHSSANRAGFSVIVLGDDKRGIELAFWTNTIFAQTDVPLFTHGEEASFNTTGGFVNYALFMSATNYVLQANGSTILTGPVRDYTAFTGFPNPYTTPDFIFFGDDTTSGAASFNLRKVTLMLPPTLSMTVPGVVAWPGVSNQTYHVQSSTNLVTWDSAGISTSANNSFAFTNSAPSTRKFFRVVFP